MKIIFVLCTTAEHTRADATVVGFMCIKSAGRVPPTPTRNHGATVGHGGKKTRKGSQTDRFFVRVSAIEKTSPSPALPPLWAGSGAHFGAIYYYVSKVGPEKIVV